MKKIHREILNELPLILETEQGDFLEILHDLLKSYCPSKYNTSPKWDTEPNIFTERATDTDLLNSLKRKKKIHDKAKQSMEGDGIFPSISKGSTHDHSKIR